ncbi:APC family permease [Marmoricola sp. URHB0036]|uniref:APC family permease n=1 Tax=Marmoricola sp. URHB0036 TaxID=1298863 RepID=UPI000406E892|nr:APC family permease [Marmoricola sp. URHB0036]
MTTIDSTRDTAGVTSPESENHTLRGDLNTFQLLFGILAYNAPLVAVVAFLPLTIGYGNGLGAPVSYLLSGAIIALFASGFLKMSRHIDNPGGFYSYIALGLGREAGLGAAFLAVTSYYLLLLGGYALAGVLIGSFVTDTLGGPHVAWWVWAAVCQVIVGIFGYFNIELSARFLTLFMCFESALILIYGAVVLVRGGATGLSASSFTAHNITSGSIGIGLLFAALSFTGFEVTAVFRDEVRDPARTIPRAAYGFIAVIGIGYAVFTWVIIQAYGPANAVAASATDPTGSVTATFRTFLGGVGVHLVSVLVITSGFASLIAVHGVLSRYLFNLGVDRILPRRLGAVHARHGSPHQASVFGSIIIVAGYLVSVLLNADPSILYAQLWGIFGYALQILFVLTTLAVLAFMWRKRPSDTTVWHRAIAPVLALVGLVVMLWLATTNIQLLIPGSGAVTITYVVLAVAIAAGVLYALAMKRARPDIYQRIGRR